MVSLRERKSRPSYAAMAEGLENLSDDEEDADSKQGSASGSGSGSPRGSKSGSGSDSASGSHSSSDDESSVSSGDSSEFDPEAENGDKKKGKGVKGKGVKGKGQTNRGTASKGNGTAASFSENDESSSFEDSDEDEEEDDLLDMAEDGDGGSIVDDDTLDGAQHASKWPRQKLGSSSSSNAAIGASVPPRTWRTIDAKLYSPSDTKITPRAYQDLLKNSARVLSQSPNKGVKDPKLLKIHHDRQRNMGMEGFSTGPLTPFVTRLESDPRDHWSSGVQSRAEPTWIPDTLDGDRMMAKRRERIWKWEYAVATEVPWQVWEGEGWWHETKVGESLSASGSTSESGKGKGKEQAPQRPPGWILRQEVRLGLEGVGRFDLSEMQMLSEQDAESFLPTLIDIHGNTWVPLQCGQGSEAMRVNLGIFDNLPLNDLGSVHQGFLLSTGGPVWGVDWCPQGLDRSSTEYLAVSSLPHIETQPSIGEKWPEDTPGSIQIWSMSLSSDSSSSSARCDIVLCIQGGNAMDVKWMPLGAWDEASRRSSSTKDGSLPKLGILAAVQLDGSISLYSVPTPASLRQAMNVPNDGKPLYLKSSPLLKLQVDDAACNACDWLSGGRLVAGLSNAHVVVWDVLEALKAGEMDVSPTAYTQIAMAAVRSVNAVRIPHGTAQGLPQYDRESTYLLAGTYDGNAILLDTRDASNPIELDHQRTPIISTAFSSQLQAPLYGDGDFNVVMQKQFGAATHRSNILMMHRGPVWSIATSDYHTMAVSGGADGAVLLSNLNRGWHKRKGAPVHFLRRFEMDYDHESGTYRMVDQFHQESVMAQDAIDRGTKLKKGGDALADPAFMKSVAWSPHCAIHKVTWNSANGLNSAGWLASGMASGLVRVEWVSGRFQGDTLPIRMKDLD
ncbi:hypothetical protein BD324DRAFT_647634 [Kockovaella imperatae]|uniref:WD40-repeat-containing domain protein n=1 Tax=Kockovaella imperatae TaxID=4999 RepID=A0A1Y1UTG2_9TREE|nr:hypothetical protein BD324DRAFT_647634 [Kockovaella imperatae]ORX40716.1 hypothetical protein BD324DRAFT_647634 [Kockovaella imperatae]